jgi:hypothetical protein
MQQKSEAKLREYARKHAQQIYNPEISHFKKE